MQLTFIALVPIGLFATIAIVDKLYRHGTASLFQPEHAFHLGDGKNVYVNVNGSIELRKKGIVVVTLDEKEAIEMILQRSEECLKSSGSIVVNSGVEMQCEARDGRINKVNFRDQSQPENDTITLNGNQFMNLLVIIWHRYIFGRTPLEYARQALLPLGNNVYVGVCRERTAGQDSTLMFIRKFMNSRPLYQGINLNRTQTYTLLYATQCFLGEKKTFDLGGGVRLSCALQRKNEHFPKIVIHEFNNRDNSTLHGIELNVWQLSNLYRVKYHLLERFKSSYIPTCSVFRL